MIRRLFLPFRRFILRKEIKWLEERIYDGQRSADMWPTHTKAAWLRELARLKGDLDRLNGRKSRVSWAFTPKERKQ